MVLVSEKSVEIFYNFIINGLAEAVTFAFITISIFISFGGIVSLIIIYIKCKNITIDNHQFDSKIKKFKSIGIGERKRPDFQIYSIKHFIVISIIYIFIGVSFSYIFRFRNFSLIFIAPGIATISATLFLILFLPYFGCYKKYLILSIIIFFIIFLPIFWGGLNVRTGIGPLMLVIYSPFLLPISFAAKLVSSILFYKKCKKINQKFYNLKTEGLNNKILDSQQGKGDKKNEFKSYAIRHLYIFTILFIIFLCIIFIIFFKLQYTGRGIWELRNFIIIRDSISSLSAYIISTILLIVLLNRKGYRIDYIIYSIFIFIVILLFLIYLFNLFIL